MFRLRSAVPEDAAPIAHLHRTARAAAMPWLPVIHTPDEDLAYFSSVVLPRMEVTVAVADDAVCAFMACADDWVHHLYVAPEFWRSGAGSALLKTAQANAARLQLWTFQGNAIARAFYARHGFLEIEFTDGSRNEEHTPDVRCVWTR